MTRCNKREVNRKSTAYNQDGQNYFEQLTAYNSMSAHLRRILLAKCVVDARNKTYMCKRKQPYKRIDWKPQFVKTEITNNLIDKLAYDASYHPVDFLRINYDSNYLCQYETQNNFTNCYECDVLCSRAKTHNHVPYSNSLTFKINNSEAVVSNSNDIKQQSYVHSNADDKKILNPVDAKTALKIQNRYGQGSMFHESASNLLSQNINHLLSEDERCTSRYSANYKTSQTNTTLTDNQRIHVKNEEAKYAKFMYEITHEIIRNCLYTDKELEEVFKKHIEGNKTVLDMNRMLYEIDQLKLDLSIPNNSKGEELDLVNIQQLLNVPKIQSQTPPKILNKNKFDEVRHDSIGNSNKSAVVLIDTNTKLHVTEKDVLTSLIEADIDPEQAQNIYKKLYYKSKDIFSSTGTKVDQPNGEYEMEENSQFNYNLTESLDVLKIDQ